MDTLQGELQKVWVQVQELEEACICARMEINKLHLRSEGKVKSWPSNLYTKLAATVLSLKEAAARERQPQQQQLQIHIKKLEKQLAEAKKALAKAKKDIIKERKARQLLELICAKLACEIGQGKMELDLKQESMLINHQGEAKHRILPMSEARQEEKLQVKLTEAEFKIAHKNLSIDAVEQEVKDFFNAAATRRRI
ncbi:hypothetical protein O6H91_04G029900 [Diphasiastrum complanatum]|nr:hypothetical protein O6H91_04G029900 [Diphasiastrum complanatum]